MIVIYDRNDSVQYHKTTITIVIDDLQIVASLTIIIMTIVIVL